MIRRRASALFRSARSTLPSTVARASVSVIEGSGGASALPWRLESPDHVHGHDRSFAALGHVVDRQVVEHAPVDQQTAEAAHRRRDAGDRHAGADGVDDGAAPVDDEPAGEQVGADREERPLELLDLQLPEQPVEHHAGLARTDEGDARERVVVERRPPDELVPAACRDLVRLGPRRRAPRSAIPSSSRRAGRAEGPRPRARRARRCGRTRAPRRPRAPPRASVRSADAPRAPPPRRTPAPPGRRGERSGHARRATRRCGPAASRRAGARNRARDRELPDSEPTATSTRSAWRRQNAAQRPSAPVSTRST